MNLDEIKERIMHRDNMLLIDSVDIEGETAVAVRQIRNDDIFLIHIDDKMAFPSFLYPEIMAQTALFTAQPQGKLPLLLGISKMTIDGYAFVGQTLRIEARSEYFSGSAGQAECIAFCENRIIAKGKILFCLKESNAT